VRISSESFSLVNLGLLGPEGGLACIAGIPDLSVVPDLPYSISIHDIGLGGVMVSPAFRRRQEDLGRMATELMALVQDGKITPIVAEQIYVGSNSKGIGTSGRGACPRQNSCQSAKLIRVNRVNSDPPTPLPNTQISKTAHFDPGRWTQIGDSRKKVALIS
jgi:hypothetical protein